MEKPRLHKIYYVSGIISMILVPFMFWYFSRPKVEELNLRVIDLGLPAKAKNGEILPENMRIPIKGWDYKSVDVPENFSDKTERDFILKIENLRKKNIDKTGIKFQFSDQNTYGDFVRLLNIMLKTKQEMYGVDMQSTNSLYVLYFKPNFEEDGFGNDVVYYGDMNEYDYSNANLFKKFKKYSLKESFYLIVGYLILVVVSLYRLRFQINGESATTNNHH